ncbi:MAG: cbb3-type cytochrome oxidase assembly protein CcoS [Xanthomonadales bacterium]|nr:cbb3-type cytochrome oxidase assembly protein CcoS [Xanthomonadales bacterium]
MTSLYFMIPLGLMLSGLAIWLFVWALKGGQFEDLDSPGWGIIMDKEKTLDNDEGGDSDDQSSQQYSDQKLPDSQSNKPHNSD